MEKLLTIKQNNEGFKNDLHVQDIRNICHLLNGIEMLHKLRLFNSEKSFEFNKLDTSKKRKLYHSEYRITVLRINKNSPLELVLLVKFLNESIELVDLLFNNEQQEEALKFVIGQICSIDFDLNKNKSQWKKVFSAIVAVKKIINRLNMYYEITQE
jgi:hypothetical protein